MTTFLTKSKLLIIDLDKDISLDVKFNMFKYLINKKKSLITLITS
jgi:hypothetical protein